MNNRYKEIHTDTLNVYSRQAKIWDEERAQSSFSEVTWINKLLGHLPTNGKVLDIGCGGGVPVSQYVLENGFSVVGIDTSQELLELSRSRFPKARWFLQDMRNLNLSESFDGIIAWDSFFHLSPDEQRAVLVTFSNHLAPDGALLLTVGPEEGEVLGEVGGEKVYHSSLRYDEYKSILQNQNVEILDFVRSDASCGFHTILLGKKQS